MKKLAILLTLFAFSACTTQEPVVIDVDTTETETQTDAFGLIIGEEENAQAAQALKMKEVACEDSGGSFNGTECECPDDTYGDNWPLYTYDEDSGYCMDAFGVPGGILGEQAKDNHPLSE